MRPTIETWCGPIGSGSSQQEVAGRALEAIVLRDYCGWSLALIGKRIGYSERHVSYLVRRWRPAMGEAARRIAEKLAV